MSPSSESRTHSPRVARKRARARDRLVEATRRVIEEQGFEHLTIEAVAAAADVSKPSVYYYFDSKEALFAALLVRCTREENAAIRAAVDATPEGGSVIEALVRAYVGHHIRSLALFRASYAWSQAMPPSDSEALAAIDEDMSELFGAVEARLEVDAAAGRLHPGLHTRRAAVGAWASAHGLVSVLSVLQVAESRLLHTTEDMVGTLCEMLTRGIYREQPQVQAPRG